MAVGCHHFLPCVPDQQNFRPCPIISLLWEHPSLLAYATVRHPLKSVALISNTDVVAVRDFCTIVPDERLGAVLPCLLDRVSWSRCRELLAPLLNPPDVRATVARLTLLLDAHPIVEVVEAVHPQQLAIVLRAPCEAIVALVGAIDVGRITTVLIPVLREPTALLEGNVVPLITRVQHPELIAAIMNQVQPLIILWMIRGLDADQLVALVDALLPEDLEPDSTVTMLLRELADRPDIVQEKVLPLLRNSEPTNIVQLMRGVRAGQLLAVLQCVEVEGVVRLLENTNAELVVRLFDSLEATVTSVAGGLAGAMRHTPIATTVRHVTDALNDGLVAADKVVQDVRDKIYWGSEEQDLGTHTGSEEPQRPNIVDFTRRLSEAIDRGKQALADAVGHHGISPEFEAPMLATPADDPCRGATVIVAVDSLPGRLDSELIGSAAAVPAAPEHGVDSEEPGNLLAAEFLLASALYPVGTSQERLRRRLRQECAPSVPFLVSALIPATEEQLPVAALSPRSDTLRPVVDGEASTAESETEHAGLAVSSDSARVGAEEVIGRSREALAGVLHRGRKSADALAQGMREAVEVGAASIIPDTVDWGREVVADAIGQGAEAADALAQGMRGAVEVGRVGIAPDAVGRGREFVSDALGRSVDAADTVRQSLRGAVDRGKDTALFRTFDCGGAAVRHKSDDAQVEARFD